jgi:methionyl-tRNA formyltransferase
MGAELMVETLLSLERGTLSPVPQDDKHATYAPILKREDGLVDWHRSSKQILDRKRGFTPFPGCYTLAASRRLEVVAADDMTERNVSGQVGEVVEIGKTYFSVQCGGKTQLRVTEVQPEGRRIMQVREYLNGAGLSVGTRLG